MKKIIHHGSCDGKFEPRRSETDYFGFFHKPCADKQHKGGSYIYAVLIDNSGRVIFNFECADCGSRDALKTRTDMFNPDITIEHIYLSPSLKKRIGRHEWDNL